MKKIIYIFAAIFTIGSLSLLLVSNRETKPEKVVIQTQLVQIKVVEKEKFDSPEIIHTKWVRLKDNKTKDISFYTDAATLNDILAKVDITNNLFSNSPYYDKKILYGNKKKFTWLVVRNDNTTYLKLICPEGKTPAEQSTGC